MFSDTPLFTWSNSRLSYSINLMEKKNLTLSILCLLVVALATEQDSTNHMNGPGNHVLSGHSNSANGADNTFQGNHNHA